MKSNEILNKYKIVLPSGAIYEHEFKPLTPFRSVKITLLQNKKLTGTLETIKFIANRQYALDNWKLDIISNSENKFIYVEHGQKSYAVLFRFLKDNNKSMSAFFAKNETVYDIKKYLNNTYFSSETNNDPSKIILFKGETMFTDKSVVEDLNIQKHDCLIVSIKGSNNMQNSIHSFEEGDEFHFQESDLNIQKKEKRSPRHLNLNLKFSGKNINRPDNSSKSAREPKMVSNEFMHCQPIRASFPEPSGNSTNDFNDSSNFNESTGINYNSIGNSQISKPKTRKPKESPPVRLSSYKSPNEKSRIPSKRISPHSIKKSNGTNSSLSNLSGSGNSKQHQQIVSEKKEKKVLVKPESKNHVSSPKMKLSGNHSPKKQQEQSNFSNSNDLFNENEMEIEIKTNNKQEEADDNHVQFEISDQSEEEDSDGENTFMFEDTNDDVNDNENNEVSTIKLPLPFQLPNGTVQSIMLTPNDTIADVKRKFSELLNCSPDVITLNLKGQELNDDSVHVMSISEYHGTTPIMIVVHVNETRPCNDKIQYFFRINRDDDDSDKLVAFYFDEGATVKEAREAIAGELNKESKEITLIYNCKNLSDKVLLRKLRIPVDGCIIVLVENSNEKVRLSTPLTVMKPRKPFQITFLTTDSSHQKIVLEVPPLSSVGEIKEMVANEMTNRNQPPKKKKIADSPSKTLSNSESSSKQSQVKPSILANTTPINKSEDSNQTDLSSSVDSFGSQSFVPEQIDFFFGGKMLTDDLIFDGLGVHDGSKIVVNSIRPTTAKLSRSLRLSSTGSFKPVSATNSNELLSYDESATTDDDEDIDKWEDELYQGITALELVRLQKMPPKSMPDAQKVIIYFRCNRDMKCTRRALKSMKW